VLRRVTPKSSVSVEIRAIGALSDALSRQARTEPSRLRCFRLPAEDSRLLLHLSRELGTTEVAVLRRALRELGAALLHEPVLSAGPSD